ncbi:DUF6702 family protein [Niveispirillum sp. KHB5.9]|uniref:DUF6702 family protein n=1 Tax=Niveispirillum sp. KHB5.9 TaxID=3400269 RepID=UPI003A8B1F1F
MTGFSRRRLLVLAGAGLLAGPAFAHRARSALTLVTWNKAAGLLEIDHSLHGHDAEMALDQIEHVAGPDLSLLEHRARLALYVEARFALSVPGAGPLALKLLGAEQEGDNVHLYQEIALPAPPARLGVRNNILRDLFAVQINQVNFDMSGDPDRIRTLSFLGGDGEKEVSL